MDEIQEVPPVNVRIVSSESDTAKRVILISGIAAILTAGILGQRYISSPDTAVTVRLHALNRLRGYSRNRAEFWSGIYTRTSNAYLNAGLAR